MTTARRSFIVLLTALALCASAFAAPQQRKPPTKPYIPSPPKTPKRGPVKREYATGTIVAIDEVAFDPYWRDACRALADALQPLADIASKPPVNDSLEEAKRHEDARAVVKEVRTLRADATKARRLWVVWVAEPKFESIAFFLSENRHDIADDLKVGRSINSEMFAARLEDGFATQLKPLGDEDAANAKDVKATAASIRGRWAPLDVKTVRAGLKKEPKSAPIGGFDPPKLNEDSTAMKVVKFQVEESKASAANEVTVRFNVPEGLGNFSMITFRLYAKNKDGTRGTQIGSSDLVAWGYAQRPALLHVPVPTPSASGYDVEIVAARYR